MIPKIIHCIQHDKLNENYFNSVLSRYSELYQEFELKLWSDIMCYELIEKYYPEYSFLINSEIDWETKSSILQFFILFTHGGLFIDCSLYPIRNIYCLIESRSMVVKTKNLVLNPDAEKYELISSDFIACEKHHPFIHSIIKNINKENIKKPDFLVRLKEGLFITELYSEFSDKSALTLIRDHFFGIITHDILNNGPQLKNLLRYLYFIYMPEPAISSNSQEEYLDVIRDFFSDKALMDMPLISCLCVSNNKEIMVKRCIQSFNEQLYENKELIIIYEKTSKAYSFIENISQKNINTTLITSNQKKKNLGELRNIGIVKSSGQYLIQWDDDDVYDPHRIFIQYAQMVKSGCNASILNQVTIYDSLTKKYSLSKLRVWEGTVLFDKSLAIKHNIWYPDLIKGEDTPFIEMIQSHFKIQIFNDPYLYLYITHTHNAFNYKHHSALIKTKFYLFKTYLKNTDNKLLYFNSIFNSTE